MTKYPCLHLRSNFGPSSCYILVYLLPIETKKIRRWTEDDKNMSPFWRNGKEYNEKTILLHTADAIYGSG